MISPVPLLRGDTKGIEADWRDVLPVNMYPIRKKILGADGYMQSYPGISSFGTGVGRDRGGFYNERQGAHYRVSGSKFISVSSTGVVTQIGTVTGTKQVSLPYSFNTQAIIADGKYFLYDPDSGFRQVSDPDLGSPIDGIWIDGYYFFTDGEYIYHTDLTDEASIDPLKFATAEFMPDPSLGVSKTADNKVMVWGRYSLEYFTNIAQENFAFQRLPNRSQKIGIVATHAKTEVNGEFFIVGGRRNESVGVHAVGIGSTRKVSTREIEKLLDQYSETQLSDIRMESRVEDGDAFVIIHLPNECLLYSITIDSWTMLKSGVGGSSIPHCLINGIFDPRIGDWIYGDKRDSKIGKLNDAIFTQFSDDPQEWILYTPFVSIETQTIDEIEIETIPGLGTSSSNDASVFLSLTYDGEIYSREATVQYGNKNDYSQRFIARRLGYVDDWVGFKFRAATRSKMAFALFKVTHG